MWKLRISREIIHFPHCARKLYGRYCPFLLPNRYNFFLLFGFAIFMRLPFVYCDISRFVILRKVVVGILLTFSFLGK